MVPSTTSPGNRHLKILKAGERELLRSTVNVFVMKELARRMKARRPKKLIELAIKSQPLLLYDLPRRSYLFIQFRGASEFFLSLSRAVC